eukprot:g54644.t1
MSSTSGKMHTIEVDLSDEVYRLKQRIQDIDGHDPEIQRLVWAGKQLQDDQTLTSYGISRESTVYCLLKQRGFSGPPQGQTVEREQAQQMQHSSNQNQPQSPASGVLGHPTEEPDPEWLNSTST